jgi:cell division topological specificity factor
MGIFKLFFRERKPSALVAKERLQIILAHERASRDAPEFLPVLQRELIDVVRRYVEIRDDMIRVKLGKSGEASLLEIDVEFDGAGIKFATLQRPRPRATFEPG